MLQGLPATKKRLQQIKKMLLCVARELAREPPCFRSYKTLQTYEHFAIIELAAATLDTLIH